MERNGKTIITTHINVDFDGIASMLAAQKLYPEAIVVFPGAQGNSLRNFFIDSMVYLFNMAEIEEIDFKTVTRLVLVDTKQKNRIGTLADIAVKNKLEVHIYDHHPANKNDIKGHFEINETIGATVSILTHIIKEKKIEITPDEATIMCLGIYEDTGSFNYSSTTEKDLSAAAFLLSKGANLNTISSMISKEMSPPQLALLNDLVQTAVPHKISGIDVIISIVSTDQYIPDLAFLVQKMVKMENIEVIFAVARMGNKVYVVARSNISEVDVAAILRPLGGGGHPYAASATIRDKTLAQTEQILVTAIHELIKPKRNAVDLMSSPAITARPDITCEEARQILTRYNINALIVSERIQDRDDLLGYISRQVIEKAIFHKLEDIHISEYMNTEMLTSAPEADIFEIQEKIMENNQRILPIVKNRMLVGVVTRTDLLNSLVTDSKKSSGESASAIPVNVHARTRNIINYMKERLQPLMIDLLMTIGSVAQKLGYDAYVVGGFVRDLMLYRKNDDIDIVIEGDGISFAKKFANLVNARIHTYKKFGTAIIIMPDGFKIDVASARMEYYKFPAALPVVEMSSIKLDLFRRDFTINTLAIQLNPDKFATLIDFFAAQRDIKDKAIRILHNLSFVEDPTRVFRAIKFEQRFGFKIGKLTSGLIKNAVKMDFFKRLSGDRVFAELKQILEEENPVSAINRLFDYDLMKVLHPSLTRKKNLVATLEAVNKVLSWHDLLFVETPCEKWTIYFLIIIRETNKDVSKEICNRLQLPAKYHELFSKKRFKAAGCLYWLENHPGINNSMLYKRLKFFQTELILYMIAVSKDENVKRAITRYYTELRHVKPLINGKDLKQLGIKEGPVYRKILQAVLDAKLNGKLKSKGDEIAYLKQYLN